MCMHEDRECPGRNCRCECMTCMFGEGECDDTEHDDNMEMFGNCDSCGAFASQSYRASASTALDR